MSAISFAKAGVKAFSREKPHSSITNLVDLLTSSDYELEAYDGIPELAVSINLQASGPTESSRALRKKLKHGSPHQQYRSLVILKALVENCGHKFQTTFADGHLIDALKHLACDPTTDTKVRKKVIAVLASWHSQFKSDPSMTVVAGLYKECHIAEANALETLSSMGIFDHAELEAKKKEKEAAKKAKKEKEKTKREEEKKRKAQEAQIKRAPFVFEKEKPKVLTAVANASQATNNLVNAIILVNLEKDTLQANERVQECLTNARQARKAVVTYIQLVENEEIIGTLIEANDRIVVALEIYDQLSKPRTPPTATNVTNADEDNTSGIVNQETEPVRTDKARVHPDLEDLEALSFGPLGNEQKNLPPPLRPSVPRRGSSGAESDTWKQHGSLSDFSDYDSSDEETHNAAAAGPSQRRKRSYVNVSEDSDDVDVHQHNSSAQDTVKGEVLDDPFSDPFA